MASGGSSDLSSDFLLAMRRLATTVSIITCADDQGRYGITATAVTSVCSTPPTVLACINASSGLYDRVDRRRFFCINLLRATHAPLSHRFGSRDPEVDRFSVGRWAELDELPYLEDAQASLFCSVQQVVRVGSHGVFVAEVEHIKVGEDVDPLIYQNGSYARTLPMTQQTL
jgi:flavin reductase